ncbi:MAG: sel1 repeat family protein, partial [Elusimicrobia bacterium]|nr:sel1 repeat family protein [Elusimicrobiota bacterium]
MTKSSLAAGLGILLASAVLASPANAAGLTAALKAYHRRDFAAALKLAEPLAKKGAPHAQMLMGMINFVGPEGGLRSNLNEAAKWFSAARDRKDAEAAFAYAVVLDMGGARPDDLADAMRRAAELGSPAARKRMAVFYMTGA